ncbi:MAG: TonB-dependent receptor [Pseudomonadota bacterium]
MRNRLQTSVALTSVLMTSLWAGSAAPANAQAAGDDGIDEVIVTATKRAERLQDVPLSIDAFDAVAIKNADIEEISDIVLLTPGLQFAESIGRQTGTPAIRGISPFAFSDPTVLVFVDGFTLGFTRTGNNAALFDLERIEVLKGPQATLYGRNALGGVINYITKKPGDAFEGYVKAEIANYDTQVLTASVGGPIVEDKVFAKLSGSYRNFGGFIDNEFDGSENINDEEDILLNGNLRLTPNENLEVNFTLNYAESEDACGDCSFVPRGFGNRFNPQSYLDIGAGLIDFNSPELVTSQNFPGGQDRDEVTAVMNVEWDLGPVLLNNVTGWANSDSRIVVDVERQADSGPFGDFFDLTRENEGWSTEFRLTSDTPGPFQWLVGTYYYEADLERLLFFSAFLPNAIDSTVTDITNAAAFLNVDYSVTDALTLGFGLRYDYEENQFESLLNGETRDTDANVWLPKFTATYQPSSDTTFYGTISRGYHAGGTNPVSSPVLTYDPEFVWNYEVGVKGQAMEGRLRYEFSAYYLDWLDQQVQQTAPQVGVNTYITNAGESHVFGIEASLSVEPVENLTLSIAGTVQEAEFDEFINVVDTPALGIGPDLSGNRLINAPEVAVSGTAQYIVPEALDGWNLRMRSDFRYTGDQAIDLTNLAIADDYVLANIYAGLENDRFEIGLFADNVFDERYIAGGLVPSSFFPPLVTVGDPRTYGVRGRVNF